MTGCADMAQQKERGDWLPGEERTGAAESRVSQLTFGVHVSDTERGRRRVLSSRALCLWRVACWSHRSLPLSCSAELSFVTSLCSL